MMFKYNDLQGLSLSGCEDRTFCITFENRLKESYPDLTDKVIVVSDTLAPIALVCESGTYLFYNAFYFLPIKNLYLGTH